MSDSIDEATKTIHEFTSKEYEWGFVTDIESETFPPGLNEQVVAAISKKKNEPQWMTAWRLNAYRQWTKMSEPHWPNVVYPAIDYQAISYYSEPKAKKQLKSLDEVDPELRRTFDKLGISLEEQRMLSGVAVDAVFDSVAVATTFKGKLADLQIVRVAQLRMRMPAPAQAQQRQVRIRVRAHDLGRDDAAVMQHAFDAPCALHHVVIGERIAVGRNDHAGAGAVIEVLCPAGAAHADHRRPDGVDDADHGF